MSVRVGGSVPEIVNIVELFFFALILFVCKFLLRWENCETHLDFLPLPPPRPPLALIPQQGRKKQLVQSLGDRLSSGPRVGRRRGWAGGGWRGARRRRPREADREAAGAHSRACD